MSFCLSLWEQTSFWALYSALSPAHVSSRLYPCPGFLLLEGSLTVL